MSEMCWLAVLMAVGAVALIGMWVKPPERSAGMKGHRRSAVPWWVLWDELDE